MRDLDPTHWYAQLSWVGQNPHLPGATIRENILPMGNGAEDERLQTVLDDAGVSEFLPLLENGIDSPLGDNASRLSIGQAQRVAVARALLPQCRLLLLDEPVASLDAHSEQRVMQALTRASRQQTTLMVTHQLDDIVDWDTIWVMRHGQIVEQGNFATLSKANGPFAALRTHRQEEI